MRITVKINKDAIKKKIEKAFHEGAMKKHSEIARSMICPEHKRHPTITFTGFDLRSHKTNISCCCEPFLQQVKKRLANK